MFAFMQGYRLFIEIYGEDSDYQFSISLLKSPAFSYI